MLDRARDARVLAGLAAGLVLLAVASPRTEAAARSQAATTEHTVVVLDTPRPLSELTRTLANARPRVVALEHTGSTRGGFVAAASLSMRESLTHYAEGLGSSAADAVVFAMRLEGRISSGELGIGVSAEAFVPANAAVVVAPPSLGAPLIQILERRTAERRDTVHRLAVISPSKKWMPQSGRVNAFEIPARTECFLFVFNCRAIPRGEIDHHLTWASADDIAAFGNDAYEHDLKLWNTTSPSFCLPFDSRTNDFWLTRSQLIWTTTLPAASKPYLDTAALDDCTQMDLTIGIMWPKNVQPNVTYAITVVADRGDTTTSSYTLEGQRVTKVGDWCDFSEWCPIAVNDWQLVVQQSDGVAPGCRDWRKDQQPSSAPCP
jgi:hypothetical protein